MAGHSASGRQGLGVFVPADVRAAISRGEPRRERSDGSVLIADVAGFTPLTEDYARAFGPRRGAEEIATLLNRVYGALVDEVDRVGGTVVEFAGDAICCCLHDDDGSSALRCAMRMQAAMAHLRSDGVGAQISVAVAGGAIRRIAVGDPERRLFEVLAGPAVQRVAQVGAHAQPGEVVAHAAVLDRLGGRLTLLEARGGGADRCAVVGAISADAQAQAACPAELDDDRARPWVPPEVDALLNAGEDEQLVGELRSVVVMFARFDAIDYDADDAGARLDSCVRFAQATIAGLGGVVFNIAVDEKGSYLCAGFGAPVAHDNDAQRAAAAALALRAAPPEATVAIGLTRGRTFAGIYGGATRRVFGVQGTRANLAARLMQLARPGEILVEEALAKLLQDDHELDRRLPVRVKGREELIALRELKTKRRGARTVVAAEPRLVGRADERALLDERLRALLGGEGGVLMLEGEPGIGKSRLLRHLAERATHEAIAVHSGAGDPIDRGVPYHAWRAIFGAGAGIDDPAGSPIGELSGEARAEATRDVLAARLAAMAAAGPTLIVLEDAHWLDSASLALATRIAGAPGSLLLVLTTRPVAEAAVAELDALVATRGCRRVWIGPLRSEEIRAVAAGAVGVQLPASVAALVEAKAGGNPLFSRELALALRDRGVLGGTMPWRGEIEAPDSVEAAIASRVDRLPAGTQAVLKVASVLGRSFPAGALRELTGAEVDDELAILEELDLLGRNPSAGGGALAFRHALIRDVVYEQLLYAHRRDLHRRAAEYLDGPGTGAATDAALAHHWDRAGVAERAVACYASGGETAFQAGAFRECVDMLERALELCDDRIEPLSRARWQWQVAQSCYRLGELELCHRRAAAAIATLDRPTPDGVARIAAAVTRELLRQIVHRLVARLPRRAAPRERERLRLGAETQFMMAEVHYLSSDTPRSCYAAIRSLNIAERLGPSTELAECFGAIAIIAGIIGAHAAAERYGALARAAADELGDPFAVAITLHQQSMYRSSRGPYERFADDYRRGIEGFRTIGHKPRLRDALGVGGIGDHLFGRPAEAERKLHDLLSGVEPNESSLPVTWAHAWIGIVALRRGDPFEATRRLGVAAGLLQDRALDMTSVSIHATRALALRRSGQNEPARREQRTARELVRRLGPRPTSHALLDGYAALAELALLDWDEARSWRARARARRRVREALRNLRVYQRTFRIGGPARWLYEGERLWRLRRRKRAIQAWARAGARAAELDMRYELALSHAVLGDRLPGAEAERRRHRTIGARLLAELGSPAHTRPVTQLPVAPSVPANPEAVDVEH